MAADTHLPVCVGMARALIPLAGHEEQEAAGESTPQRRKKSAGASQGDSPVKLKRPRIVDQAQAQRPKEKFVAGQIVLLKGLSTNRRTRTARRGTIVAVLDGRRWQVRPVDSDDVVELSEED